MVGRIFDIDKVIVPDQLGTTIAQMYMQWDLLRQEKIKSWEELRRYIYSTDTRMTSNATLPWKNTTTIPKLCQIRDNLFANYMASIFPKRKWLTWEGSEETDVEKIEAIRNYAAYWINHDSFKKNIAKLIYDYIDYGNCFATIEWADETQVLEDTKKTKVGYVGPVIKRISPLDIVMNPTGTDFVNTPKIIRSLITKGECKEILERFSTDDTRKQYEELWDYMKYIRTHASTIGSNTDKSKNDFFRIDGFTSYRNYLTSNYVELLTFYGDIYNNETDEFLRNQVIVVADRHKIIWQGPNPSFFGHPPIYHAGWRVRQDNLWAMGPLDNLVGMQYRIDHVENLKADVFDLTTFPPLKVKGYVEDFEWGPMERIYVGDTGDVEMISPPFQILTANSEIEQLCVRMEEMAGSPKEAMGFRTPGEKTAYEVQRLENAASRIFTNKTAQFEEQIVENLLNGMLELSKRNMTKASIRILDDEFKAELFQELTPDDITGNGKLKPIAARHFAERAEAVQNLTNFFSSPIGQDQTINQHFSSIKMAKLFEELLEINDYELVTPYIRIAEQADAQRNVQALQQQVAIEAQTPAGLSPDDYDKDMFGEKPEDQVSPIAAQNVQAPENV